MDPQIPQDPQQEPEPIEVGAAEYWAAFDTERLGPELQNRIDLFYDYCRSSGRLAIWNKSYRAHFAGYGDGGMIQTGGTVGEQTLLKVNHLRNINTHIVNQITSQRPAFDAKAVNSDFDSYQQTILAQEILDYQVMRALRLESIAREGVEHAVVYGEGFLSKLWDPAGGTVMGKAEDGQPITNGTLEFKSYHPVDVPRDFTQEDWRRQKWCMLRDYVNKYDLVSQYPEYADEIMNSADRFESYNQHPTVWFVDRWNQKMFGFSDEIEVFWWFHARSKALPAGRRCLVVGSTVLDDGPLPYRDLPVYRIAAGKQQNTSFGYTINFDCLSIQDAINSLYSTIATNQSAYGIQSIWSKPGQDVSVTQLSTGMQLVQSEIKPESLQLTQTAPETFTFLTGLIKGLETLTGINDVIRGNPENVLKSPSGSALALVASQALQFSVHLQSAYIECLEDICSGAIDDYVRFADLEQVVLIAGKSTRSYLKSFRGNDLDKVTRVVVDVGNPLSRTLAGRDQMAQQLIQAKLITTPEQYLTVMATGRLEPISDGMMSENMLIKAENEALTAGQEVPALATDRHSQHVKEHKSVLASPESRKNATVVKNALGHIQQHINLRKSTDPNLLMMIGEQPIAPPPPPNPASQSAWEATVADASNPAAKNQTHAAEDVWKIAGKPNPVPPEAQQAPFSPGMPHLPSPPTNPGTRQPAPGPQQTTRAPGVQPARR